jgi:hypothetical protein
MQRMWMFPLLAVCGLAGGCVERVAKIQTQPPGALVTINDEEVGASPVAFNFIWYGDYDIIVRKPGYETLKTHYRIDPPWYQIPPLDLVSETLIPTTIRDERTVPTLELKAAEQPSFEDVVERATEMRDRALFNE